MYQNLKRYRAYQIICCKATSLCEIMSREDKITIWSKRALKRIFIGSKYSLNIAQDPTYPSIWKYLSRNIFNHKRNSFLSNVPGGQKWKSLSMWQFRKELKIRWKQFVTLLMNKYNQNIIKIWLLYVTTTLWILFCPPGTSDLTKKIIKKGVWVKWGGPAFFPHWVWYDHTKSKPNLYICKNWGFGFSSVPGGRILPILQECPNMWA